MKIEEQISQFLDGELDSAQSTSLIKQLRDQRAAGVWSRYHLIGDALRKDLPNELSQGLAARVSQALDNEPNLFAPNALQVAESPSTALPAVEEVAAKPASRFHWGYGLAASAALVVVLSLQFGQQSEPGLSATLAQVNAPTATISPSIEMSRPQITTVAGIDRPVVKPAPPAVLAEQNPVPGGHWKRLDLSRPEFSPYVQPSSGEFSVVPGVVPSRPMAHVASFGENKAQ